MKLAAGLVAIVAIWGWLLPAIGSRADVRASLQRTQRQGIDPGAIFYTDVFIKPTQGSANHFFDKGKD